LLAQIGDLTVGLSAAKFLPYIMAAAEQLAYKNRNEEIASLST